MEATPNSEKINTLLNRAVSGVFVRENLEKRLKSGKPLRVKFGIDPTSADIHLGHAVPLLKLRQFQELGHKAILIIGDFTAMVGDPSGRAQARISLTAPEIKKNLKNYLSQAEKIINIKETEVHFNNEWFGKMKPADFYKLLSNMTVQQVLKREDFKNRIENNQDINATEMMYPLFQGYDSVMVKADVEIGGEDQLLNLLAGRKIQRSYGMPEQDILTTWLIEGTDGKRKMSKSFGNYISINEKPEIMFAKLMSIPDYLIIKYFKALTGTPSSEIKVFDSDMEKRKLNPRDLKSKLAFEIVKNYHGGVRAKKAEKEFERVFKKHELPENISSVKIKKGQYNIIDLLILAGLAPSKSRARRLVTEGAVKIDSKVLDNYKMDISVTEETVFQVGKRHFRKIKTQ